VATELHLLNRGGKKLLAWIGLGGSEAKVRADAENWLELADKVWAFRRDVLPASDGAGVRERTAELRRLYRSHAPADELKAGIAALEPVLKRTGGAIYPKSALIENVEFFLVAAIVIIGVRTYFVQPFKIPTNSMWPSYYGMTPDVYHRPEDVPGVLTRAARFVFFGARHYEVTAPSSGTISVLVAMGRVAEGGGRLGYNTVPARSWLVFPTTNREYPVDVNGTPMTIQVPQDFDFDWAIKEAFDITPAQLAALAEAAPPTRSNYRWVTLPRRAEAGKAFLSFDVVTGDQLFVDRITYNFFRPKVGQGFVFFTGNIPGIASVYGEQYYIKRLVGVSGDTLQIKPPVLWRNGQPITGADAFAKNARQTDRYAGYVHVEDPRGQYLLTDTDTLTVPANNFFAMGDNSNNSFDGRFWGFVPAKEVIGRPLFIYFPFSKRWGPSR
jgi:signal peptidase I